MHYATLYQVKQYLSLAATETRDDSRLIQFINEAVAAIDKYKGRRFDVRKATRLFDYPAKTVNSIGNYSGSGYMALNYLRMDDLLEVVSLTNGDGTAIVSTAYVLDPEGRYPKYKLTLLSSSGVGFSTSASGDYERAISLAGLWGYHETYDTAFETALDTVRDNPLTAMAMELTVSDADGVALDGSAQRFQAGQMLKIESEYLYVASVSNTTNKLVVARGYNGTTAAAHTQGTAIYIYRPMQNIVAACTRLVAWRYRQKDADVFDATTIMGSGVRIVPSAMPKDVISLLGAPKMEMK